jgi:ketosteroid isomerase-like protein
MQTSEETDEIDRFVERWLRTYADGDAAETLRFYHCPLLAIFPDRMEWLGTEAEIEALLSELRIDVPDCDPADCGIESLSVHRLTDADALVSGSWVRTDASGATTDRVTFTDLLHRTDDGWKIAVAVAHPPENVLT